MPISFADAALGGDLEVPTLDGRVNLKNPAETQTGKVFRLRGKGVTQVRQLEWATCYARFSGDKVKLTDEQKQLLEQLKQSLGDSDKHSPKGKTWFDGVKDFFETLKS